jgi:hypothetical protein
MSDTPRTDAAILDVLQSGQHYKVKADFARKLERESQQLSEQYDELWDEYRQAVHCREAWIALQELDEEMRRIVKHGTQPGDPSTVTALAARIRDIYTIPALSILES